MDSDISSSQISAPHDVFSVQSSKSANDWSKTRLSAAQVLYVQVPILTGSVQTDKKHVHDMYVSMELAYTSISYQATTYNQLHLSIILYATLSHLTMQPVR